VQQFAGRSIQSTLLWPGIEHKSNHRRVSPARPAHRGHARRLGVWAATCVDAHPGEFAAHPLRMGRPVPRLTRTRRSHQPPRRSHARCAPVLLRQQQCPPEDSDDVSAQGWRDPRIEAAGCLLGTHHPDLQAAGCLKDWVAPAIEAAGCPKGWVGPAIEAAGCFKGWVAASDRSCWLPQRLGRAGDRSCWLLQGLDRASDEAAGCLLRHRRPPQHNQADFYFPLSVSGDLS